MKTVGSFAAIVGWVGALICLQSCSPSIQAQAPPPLDRVRTAGLDNPQGEQLWSSVRWFEEMVATYFAYAFVYHSDPEWARAGRREWTEFIKRDPPRSATSDWRFMATLPHDGTPQRIGFRPALEGEVFGPLQDVEMLNAVELDSTLGTIRPPNGGEVDPHDRPKYRDEVMAMAKGRADARFIRRREVHLRV